MMMNTLFRRGAAASQQAARRDFSSTILRQKMETVIAARQAEAKEFKKEYGSQVIGEVTVDQVLMGMRGLPGMLYETSKLDPSEGISYRGHKLFDVVEKAPATVPGGQPIPEGILWLLLTGDYPSESEIKDLKEDMYKRGQLSADQEKLISSLPKDMHAMAQFSAGVLMCQPDSKFAKAYSSGVHKSKYWESTLEDALDVCARVSRIAALVYANKYRDGAKIADRDSSLDYSENFCNMLGFSDPQFTELMRLYLTLHA